MVAPSTRDRMDAYVLTASMCGISSRTVLAPRELSTFMAAAKAAHLGVGAVEEEVGGNTDPQPAHVPIERSFVVRDRLGRRCRIGCIVPGDGAQQARAITG